MSDNNESRLSEKDLERLIDKFFKISQTDRFTEKEDKNILTIAGDVLNMYKILFEITESDLNLSLIEKLCRLGGEINSALVVLAFMSSSRYTVSIPAGFPNLFLPVSIGDIPSECKLLEDGDGKYRLIMKSKTGNIYCSIIHEFESENIPKKYIIYPCPEKHA